jgi:dihydropteroate synthase
LPNKAFKITTQILMSNQNGQISGILAGSRQPLEWSFPGADWRLVGQPRLMGVLNVTPDSFSDGGQFRDPGLAADRAFALVGEGADIIDIGGESTRPGAIPVDLPEELSRVLPVIERVARGTTVPISIDTTKAEVARRALDAGAVIVNDVSALTADPVMPAICARWQSGVICMHMQGTPQTMQLAPSYGNVVGEISDYLALRIAALEERGIPRQRVVVDPGIGFGKTADNNLAILRSVRRFRSLGRPVLIGHSRKGFLQKLLGRPTDEVLAGTLGVAIALTVLGADLLRVHDVRAVRNALAAFGAILPQDESPSVATGEK